MSGATSRARRSAADVAIVGSGEAAADAPEGSFGDLRAGFTCKTPARFGFENRGPVITYGALELPGHYYLLGVSTRNMLYWDQLVDAYVGALRAGTPRRYGPRRQRHCHCYPSS